MSMFRRFLDRRRGTDSVRDDRRKPTMKDADAMLAESIEALGKTSLRMRAVSANDVQRVVLFDTFAELCEYRMRNGNVICKHPEHEARSTGIALCNEQQCPFMRGRSK